MDLEKLLSQMTIKEKIGQLVQFNSAIFMDDNADITGPKAMLNLTNEDIYTIGSTLGTGSFETVKKIQDEHLKNDRNKIPMLFMRDVIHGIRTIYPIPLGLSCSFDEDLVTECTKMASRGATSTGLHVTFTPMVDYCRDARWGRIMESWGEEPLLISKFGAAQVKAFQGDDLKNKSNMATCVKHFAAYGGGEAGKDYNLIDTSERILREYYLPSYKACVDARVKMLMPSFNAVNGVPSTANKWLMLDILRKEWGFDGVVISDWNAIGELVSHGIAKDKKEAAEMAFKCGCHIDMCSNSYHLHLQELVEEGRITEEELDNAVIKVLRLKEELGLFDDPYRGASKEKEEKYLISDSTRALARKAATESAVLLKNDNVLPLSADIKKLAIIGPFGDSPLIRSSWSANSKSEDTVTIYNGISSLLPDAEITFVEGCSNEWDNTDTSGFEEALNAAKNADAVILAIGEPYTYSGEGNSRADITLPGVQLQLANEVSKVNKNTVAVIFNGRPLVLSGLNVPAILEMWLPGTEGGNAVADILLGKVNPAGKLTVSLPKATGQCPLYYNRTSTGREKSIKDENNRMRFLSSYLDCGNLALYPFGYGLSYSNFVYESLEVDKKEFTEKVNVTVTVYNDSAVEGKETVQLYMRDLVASNVRPVQQLIDYEKVNFKPFERKTVTFTVTPKMLSFWNNENKFVCEKGDFEISTGYADNLILTEKITYI